MFIYISDIYKKLKEQKIQREQAMSYRFDFKVGPLGSFNGQAVESAFLFYIYA